MLINNTFNVGQLLLRNTFKCLVSGNEFNDEEGYIYSLLTVSNSVHPSDAGGCQEASEGDPFNLNIVNNQFTGGSIHQLWLNCLASDLTPFYIMGNFFLGSESSFHFPVVTNKVSGDFKSNYFTDTSDNWGSVTLYQSEMNFFGNTLFTPEGHNIKAFISSSAVLKPLIDNGNFYWFGGSNKMVNTVYSNLVFDEGSHVFVDYGQNCFTTADNYIQIAGFLDGPCATQRNFPARNNFWSPFPPTSAIYCDDTLVTLTYTPYKSTCPETFEEADDYSLTEKGDGIIDSVIISEVPSGGGMTNRKSISLNEDEELFAQAVLERRAKDYNSAITLLESLLDNHDTSEYVTAALGELYLNCSLQDSGITQSATGQIFEDLKEYLEEKMEQYESHSGFIQKAYSYYLMCLTKSLDYNDAILGYENIIENHPDSIRKVLATWDRAAVVLLQEGSGQGDNLSEKERLEKFYRG